MQWLATSPRTLTITMGIGGVMDEVRVFTQGDIVAPDTTIVTQPPNVSGSSSTAFTFTGTDPAPSSGGLRYECSLDAAAFSTCASPQQYSNLSDGSHTFRVRAIDAAGNVDPTPATQTWTIDTVSPDTFFSPNPPDRVEGPGMHHFAEDAGVEQAEVIDG